MKKLLLAALLLTAVPAHANTPAQDNARYTAAAGKDLIDKLYGCDGPPPKAKPGVIIVYYVRGANGQCVAKVLAPRRG